MSFHSEWRENEENRSTVVGEKSHCYGKIENVVGKFNLPRGLYLRHFLSLYGYDGRVGKRNQKKITSGNDKKFDDFIISIAVGVKSK